jgi:hypothetical protein
LIILTSFLISLAQQNFSFKSTGLLFFGLVLGFQSIRGFPYLVFISLPIVLQNFAFLKENLWSRLTNGIVCLLILIEANYYLSGRYYALTYQNSSPTLVAVQDAKPALDFLLQNNLPQPIFNNFDIGSYIIYRTYPKYKVFIDGRPEAYPASFFQNTYIPLQEDYAKFKSEDQRVGFNTVIFSITDQNPRTTNFLNSISHDRDWKIVFLDQFMIILVKSTVTQNLQLETINLATLNPNSYNYADCAPYTNLSTFLFNTNYFERAKMFNQKALDITPGNPAANYVMANILLKDPKPNLNLISKYLSKSQNAIFW